jgi:hypothetical protein
MTCELSYPSQILKKADPLFDSIIDEDGLLDLKDPTKNINPEKLRDATNALNNAFNGIKGTTIPANYPQEAFANDYPTLADKINTLGPMTQVETALFINETGSNPDDIAACMNGHTPGGLPTQCFNNIAGQLDTFLNKNLGAALSGGLCGAFPDVFGKIAGVIAVIEAISGLVDDIKNFSLDDFISGLVAQVLGALTAIVKAIEKTIKSIVKSIKKAVEGIAKDAAAFAKSMGEAATKILNKVAAAITQVLDFISEPNTKKLKEGIEGLVTSAASAFEKMTPVLLGLLMFRFCQLAGGVQSFLQKPLGQLIALVVAMKAAGAMLDNSSKKNNKKAVEAGAVRINPEEVGKLKDDARTRLNNAAPTTAIIVKTARDVQDLLEPPVASGIEIEEITVTPLPDASVQSVDDIVNSSLAAIGEVETIEGADVEPLEYELNRELQTKIEPEEVKPRPPMIASPFDAVEIRPYVQLMEPTDEQNGWLTDLATSKSTTAGIPGQFEFDSAMEGITVRKDGTDTEEPGPAWMEVHSHVWLQLFEVKDQIGGISLKVKAGFDPEGKPVSKTGHSVILDVSGYPTDDLIEIIIAASRAGFMNIALSGSNMILSNYGGRNGESDNGDTLLQDALKIHEAEEWNVWRPAVKVQ